MNYIAYLIATCGGLGKIKIAPGTIGSILAFPLAYMIITLIPLYDINFFSFAAISVFEQQAISALLLLLLVSIFLFFIGAIASDIYSKNIAISDPKEVIIDEVAGQMLTIALCIFSLPLAHYSKLSRYIDANMLDMICVAALPFILFRLYDITKPWPINWLDSNIKGGIGIMLDDFAAAIFATVSQYAIILAVGV